MNDLLIGFNDSSNLADPLDLLGLGKLNNRLGIAGEQRDPGPDQHSLGQQPHRDRQRRDRDQQHQQGVPDQRAADVAARPAHAEVRRVVELLPECSRTTRATTAGMASSPTTSSISRARRSPTSCWTRCRRRAEARRPTVDAVSSTHRPLCRRRLQGHRHPHVEPWPAMGVHLAVRREGRSPGQLRSDERAACCSPDRTGTAARSTIRSTTAGNRGSASPIGRASAGCSAAATASRRYMEGTGANLRLPLNPPFFFESDVRYDATSGAGTIATGFQGCRRSIAPRVRCARGIRSCGRSSRSSGTCSPSTCSARGRRSTSVTWATSRRSS